jgi:hypothetical protein
LLISTNFMSARGMGETRCEGDWQAAKTRINEQQKMLRKKCIGKTLATLD